MMQSTKRICPHCGHENIARANFCGYCGKEIFSTADETIRVDLQRASFSLDTLPEESRTKKKEVKKVIVGILIGAIIIVGLAFVGLYIRRGNSLQSKLFSIATPQASNTPYLASPTPPMQTANASATITATPVPTTTPLPPAGIGVSRSTLQTVFTNLGFAFHEAPPLYNQPRLLGVSIDRKTTIELSGPPAELIKVTLYMGDSYVGDQALVNEGYISQLLKYIAPHWQEGKKWITKTIKQLQEEKTQVSQKEIIVELIKVTLSKDTSLDLILLNFEGIHSLQEK
jgi:hypothetical protein